MLFVKWDVTWQAAFGAVDDAQHVAVVSRSWIQMQGFGHAQAECSLYFQLHGGDGAGVLDLFEGGIQIHALVAPGQALDADHLAPLVDFHALLVEQGF